MDELVIRPLRGDESDEAWDVGHAALREASERYGWEPMPTGDAVRERGLGRMRHVLEYDPEGAFVAEGGGRAARGSLSPPGAARSGSCHCSPCRATHRRRGSAGGCWTPRCRRTRPPVPSAR